MKHTLTMLDIKTDDLEVLANMGVKQLSPVAMRIRCELATAVVRIALNRAAANAKG